MGNLATMSAPTTNTKRRTVHCSKHAFAPIASFRPKNGVVANVTLPVQRHQTCLQRVEPASESLVTGDDPVNGVDPLGLCWSPIGCGALKRATKDVRSGFHKVVHYADDTRHFVATHRTEIATGAAFLSLAIPGVGEAVGLSDLAISTVAATADATSAAAGTAASVGDARSGNWTGFALARIHRPASV